MKSTEKYEIPFRGLKPGTHKFDFEVGTEFFESHEEGLIHEGHVSVHVDMEREERMLVLHFTLEGEVSIPCDRCNVPMQVPVRGKERLIVKFGEEFSEQSEEVQVIPESENKLDISSFIYEYIHLMLPLKRVHPQDPGKEGGCDPEVIKKLEELSGKSQPDPRWDVLKELKTKN